MDEEEIDFMIDMFDILYGYDEDDNYDDFVEVYDELP